MTAYIPLNHPCELWVVADDRKQDSFTVEQIPVLPLRPDEPPAFDSPYREPGRDYPIHHLGRTAFALRSEALYAAAARCDDEAHDWTKKGERLSKEASRAEDDEHESEDDAGSDQVLD
jgi:hypothetical protein